MFSLCFSGDGTFSCVNIKNRKLELQSELFDSELLSIAIMKVSLPTTFYTVHCKLDVNIHQF